MRDCPKRGMLSALVKEKEEAAKHEHEVASMGSLQLLTAIKANVRAPKSSSRLLFIQVKSVGIRALVDSGAIHNFIDLKEAQRLVDDYLSLLPAEKL